jgi:hypothetical protein
MLINEKGYLNSEVWPDRTGLVIRLASIFLRVQGKSPGQIPLIYLTTICSKLYYRRTQALSKYFEMSISLLPRICAISNLSFGLSRVAVASIPTLVVTKLS